MTSITRADGREVSLADLVSDIAAAKLRFTPVDFCFTYVTVESLVNHIQSAQAQVDSAFTEPDFQSLRDQVALKAPTVSDMEIQCQVARDRKVAGPDYIRRSNAEIISDLDYKYADAYLEKQYSHAYKNWLTKLGYRPACGTT